MGNHKSVIRHAIIMGIFSFGLAIFFTYVSEVVITRSNSYYISFFFLLFIILFHIFFDIIGIAATAANETPFHAKSAKKIRGSSQAVDLIRNADKVANWTNDVVGDITGIVGGALGVSIVIRIVAANKSLNQTMLNVLIAGLITGLTVFGKSLGKKFAITQADHIIFRVAQILAFFEETTRIKIFNSNNKNRKPKEKVTSK